MTDTRPLRVAWAGGVAIPYEFRAGAVAVAVLVALVSSCSVLSIALADGIPVGPETVVLSPVGSAAPSGSALAP